MKYAAVDFVALNDNYAYRRDENYWDAIFFHQSLVHSELTLNSTWEAVPCRVKHLHSHLHNLLSKLQYT